jgi:replicative DNA helicase
MINPTVPKNIEAEISLLGCILIDGAQMLDVADELDEEDFYDPKNKLIFKAMLDLQNEGKAIDLTTVLTNLTNNGKLDAAGGAAYLTEVSSHSYTTSYVDSYVELVKSTSLKRHTIERLNNLLSVGMDPKVEANDYLTEAEQVIFDLSKNKKTTAFVKMQEALDKVRENVDFNAQNDKDIVGLDTGYQNLNEKTLGFQASQLIILAARPGMGKSALAMNIAANIARLNNGGHARVAVFNLEMSYDQLAERMIASEANIDSKTLKSGKFTSVQSKAFNAASARLSQIDVEFDDSGNTTVEDIRTKCRKLKASDGGLDFVVIDYLQLINSSHNSKGKSRTEEVSDISRQLKLMARELGIPVLALSQLSRKAEERDDKRPMMSDLRESGAIEQDADIIMFLYRRGYYSKSEEGRNDPITELEIAKNRAGQSGVKIYFNFIGKYYKFEATNDVPSDSFKEE